MKFLLIGGNGNLGRGFAKSLNLEDSCVIWDQDENLFNLDQDTLRNMKPDVIVNLSVIANFHDKGVDPFSDYYKTNVEGLKYLINLAKTDSTPLIQISTREVIGLMDWGQSRNIERFNIKEVPKIGELEPCFPLHAYGKTKLIAEYMVQSYKFSAIVRLNTCYTDDVLSNKGLIANLYNKVISEGSIELTNEGISVRDPMHISDLVSLVKKIFVNSAYGETFHAGGGDVNILALKDICLTFNEKVEIKNGNRNKDFGFLMDISKAHKSLGWAPEVIFKDWATSTKNKLSYKR